MSEGATEGINKKEIGARIKRLRKEAGLRQWQLAELIGATQPAIHMYERGVLPEPKRLLELARIGNTSVEWILTGRHWENGSEEMPRVSEEIYHLAFQLKEYGEEDREAIEAALEVINQAASAIGKSRGEEAARIPIDEIARHLKGLADGTLQALSSAVQIHESVMRALNAQGISRMQRSGVYSGQDDHDDAIELLEAGVPAARRKRPARSRSTSIEPIRGHIFKVDGSLLIIKDILKDKELRGEFEESLARLNGKLESKRAKVLKMKKAQRGK
ncbi:MAG TPA: helix-turn-helix transcriptional regulator [Candidatus Polarisedimenticolia bacterium]|jgi:transcriptional regulator with XRE-family HTH domain